MESKTFPQNTFKQRVCSMLKVDFRRLLKSVFFYILVGACFVMPIVIMMMVTMMEGTTPINQQTGLPGEPIKGFDNAWQILGAVSGGDMANGETTMSMDVTAMCNINMLYFLIAVLVCIFVSDDFRSGYAKNLFTVRAGKVDYVLSKTVICALGGAAMIFVFFLGSLIGGAVTGLPFDMVGFNVANLVLCVLSKMLLVSVFVPIYLVMSVVAKQKVWLSILLSMMVGMFLFMMIPMLTPLNATPMHVVLCLAGGAGCGFGLGAISNLILKKTSLV